MTPREVQIIDMIGVVGKRIGRSGKEQTLQLNIASVNGGPPMFDLRWWEEETPVYGITLNERSLAELAEVIEDYFERQYHDQKTLLHPEKR